MKKIDLGQATAILANLGVIIGIAFLALELRQNNSLLEASVRQAQNDRIQEGITQLYTVPGLAEILAKANSGQPLTDVEELQLFGRKVAILRGFEAQYREIMQGTAREFPVEVWAAYFNNGAYRTPPLYDVWEEVKPLLTPSFVQYFEENVVVKH